MTIKKLEPRIIEKINQKVAIKAYLLNKIIVFEVPEKENRIIRNKYNHPTKGNRIDLYV